MMVIHRLPDPQGSEGNKIGCQNMEDSRVANGLLIPSLVKLDLTDPGGREYKGTEAQSWEEGVLPHFAFLVLKSSVTCTGPHIKMSSGLKNGGGNDATLLPLCFRVTGTQDQELGLEIPLPPQPTTSQGNLFGAYLHFSDRDQR